MPGTECIVLRCGHIDVTAGTKGKIVGELEGGYQVEVTAEFWIAGPTVRSEKRTETIWCEKSDVEILP